MRQIGAFTIGVSCNRDSLLEEASELMITPVVGPEVLSGSTRLKRARRPKWCSNTLTTASMVRLGKTYGNFMVDMRATNTKLLARAQRIVATLAEVPEADAVALLQQCGGEVKTAIIIGRCHISPEQARQRLELAHGHLRQALEQNKTPQSR